MSNIGANILKRLRECMKRASVDVEAYIIPSGDAHHSEYVAPAFSRRAFVSGFTGSAGTAVVTSTEALLWTDGRYFLQASQQMYEDWKLMKIPTDLSVEKYLAKNLARGARVGLDPSLHSVEEAKTFETTLRDAGHTCVYLEENLVDEIWDNRPALPCAPVKVLDVKYAGKEVAQKLTDLRKKMKDDDLSYIIVTALDDIAWLFNLRGADVDFNPVFLSYSVVTPTDAFLYIDDVKLDDIAKRSLAAVNVILRPYNTFFEDLKQIVEERSKQPEELWRVMLDMHTCSKQIDLIISAENARKQVELSPVGLAKAKKNEREIQGFKDCSLRDGIALVEYFCFLEDSVEDPNVVIDEVDGAEKLREFRAKQQLFVYPSFDTISSVDANAAIIHYKPEKGTCARITKNSLYLCDSGGQYLDGTTDVTRTMHFGTPTAHQRYCFTLVLKGHIGLSRVIFPEGATGLALDAFARQALWSEGLDFRHGTGHGVGSYLNVHEGPHSISFRPGSSKAGIEENMTVTNEPGYYEDGQFGIRIENVMYAAPATTKHKFDKKWLSLENFTHVPIQAKMIDVSMLTPEEISWVDTYHATCLEKLLPLMKEQDVSARVQQWLKDACVPLRRD